MNNKITNFQPLEMFRNFMAVALTPEIFHQALVLDGEESVNLRLWALREKHKLSEEEFANIFRIPENIYKKYEYRGNKVPKSFLIKVSKKFKVPLKWLECKAPFFIKS